MSKKLIYILPEASEKTHMKYNVEFIAALAKERNIDIFLITEKGNNNLTQYQTGTGPLRILKLNLYLLNAFFLGYRKVYIHYSFAGAIFASLNPFFKTYYWNCGLPWNYKRPFLQELYETSAYKLIDHFVTGTDNLAKKYSEVYKFNNTKSVIIPNWIDVNKTLEIKNKTDKVALRSELNIGTNTKVLFFNQRLSERKGAHYIPLILEKVREQFGEDFVCIVTNDGPYKEQLIQELKNKNLFDKVRILGRIPNDKVIEIMSITDVYLLSSEEEGMSHSLMEAFVTQAPAVAFSVGGNYEIYPKEYKEYCVAEKDIQQYIQKVIYLLNDSNSQDVLNFKQGLIDKAVEWDKAKILDIFIEKIWN